MGTNSGFLVEAIPEFLVEANREKKFNHDKSDR